MPDILYRYFENYDRGKYVPCHVSVWKFVKDCGIILMLEVMEMHNDRYKNGTARREENENP